MECRTGKSLISSKKKTCWSTAEARSSIQSSLHVWVICCNTSMYHWTYELHGTLFIFRWVTTYARLLYDYRSHTTCSYIHTQTWHIWLSTDCMRKYDSMRKPQKIKKIRIYSGSGVGRLFERVKARDPASYIRVHVSLIFQNMFLQLLLMFFKMWVKNA